MSSALLESWTTHFNSDHLPQRDEPLWHSELRRDAWTSWMEQAEPPALQRNLRKIPPLQLETLQAPDTISELRTDLKARSLGWGELAGLYLEDHASPLDAELDEKLTSQGVILCSLADALAHHPERVKAHLASVIPASAHPEAALNLAYWQGGYFLYVPRHVQLDLPIYALQSLQQGGQHICSRSLIVLESGARVTLIHDQWSEALSQTARHSQVIECIVGANAELNLLQIQQWSRQVHGLAQVRAHVSRDGRFNPLLVASGAAYHQHKTYVDLLEKGAYTQLLGLVLGDSDQHLRQESLQNHLSPHTESNLQYHAVLRDQAYSFYNGMIYVAEEAQQTQSNQISKNLLLSDEARADAIPNLEILADDVQSGHGAAVGSLNADQLFYLQSRGFDRATAEGLLVEGFMESVILNFPVPALQPLIQQHLAMRLLEREDD